MAEEITFARRSCKERAPRAPGKKVLWDPDSADLDRLEKRKRIEGHYINCSHYAPSPKSNDLIICDLHGNRTTCLGCGTCPRCGGRMSSDTDAEIYIILRRHKIESASCVNCGEYYETKITQVAPMAKPAPPVKEIPSTIPRCAVIGCGCRVWDKKTVIISGEDYPLCETHTRQLARWRRSSIGIPCPLIVTQEGVKENPKLKKKNNTKPPRDQWAITAQIPDKICKRCGRIYQPSVVFGISKYCDECRPIAKKEKEALNKGR